MMYTMSGMSIPGFGPDRCVFSFEDEVESTYLSSSNALPQQQDDQDLQLPVPQHLGTTTDDHLILDFDGQDLLDLVTGKPEEITGQSLAWKMKEDKMGVLQLFDSKSFSEHPSQTIDSITFPQTTDIDMKEEEIDLSIDGKALIREMEEFLSQYEEETDTGPSSSTVVEDVEASTIVVDDSVSDLAKDLLSLQQQCVLQSIEAPCPAENPSIAEQDAREAEEMLDDLLDLIDAEKPTQTDILQLAMDSENLIEDDDCITVSSVSQHRTAERENVIIVITQSEDDSDEWTPEIERKARRKPGRKAQPKNTLGLGSSSGRVRRTSSSSALVMDRKERKKLQNMEAARRYRDKKKEEQEKALAEESALAKKNVALKAQLQDIENEIKTMKRLMVELGFLKVVSSN